MDVLLERFLNSKQDTARESNRKGVEKERQTQQMVRKCGVYYNGQGKEKTKQKLQHLFKNILF